MAFLPTLCLVLNRRPIERLVSGHLLQPLALLRALDHVSLAVDEFLLSMCRVLFCFQGWRDGATASQNRGKQKTRIIKEGCTLMTFIYYFMKKIRCETDLVFDKFKIGSGKRQQSPFWSKLELR